MSVGLKRWLTSGMISGIKLAVLHMGYFIKSAKSRYKYEVRRLQRCEHFIRREKLAASIRSSDPKRFWKLVHCINKSKSAASASSVDGLSSSDQISQLFSVNLQDILNTQESQGRDSMLSSLLATLSAAEC